MHLFVYGTLKRGQANHQRYFGPDTAVESARMRGRLVNLRQGYPMLVVPAHDVLAIGTADSVADAAKQCALNQVQNRVLVENGVPRATRGKPDLAPSVEPWLLVQGEIIHLTNVSRQLSAIDALEDYDPVSKNGLYVRALVWTVEPRMAVWTYIAPGGQVPVDAESWGAEWP